jgi:hypothetical protein
MGKEVFETKLLEIQKLIEKENNSNKKLELLQTKAKLLSETLDTEELLNVREQIENILKNNIPLIENKNQINIEKIKEKISKTIKITLSEQIFDSLIKRLIQNDKKDKKEEEKIQKIYFEEAEKLMQL